LSVQIGEQTALMTRFDGLVAAKGGCGYQARVA
jgi:hypothetical protein